MTLEVTDIKKIFLQFFFQNENVNLFKLKKNCFNAVFIFKEVLHL